jgi:hypothetical protein
MYIYRYWIDVANRIEQVLHDDEEDKPSSFAFCLRLNSQFGYAKNPTRKNLANGMQLTSSYPSVLPLFKT